MSTLLKICRAGYFFVFLERLNLKM